MSVPTSYKIPDARIISLLGTANKDDHDLNNHGKSFIRNEPFELIKSKSSHTSTCNSSF